MSMPKNRPVASRCTLPIVAFVVSVPLAAVSSGAAESEAAEHVVVDFALVAQQLAQPPLHELADPRQIPLEELIEGGAVPAVPALEQSQRDQVVDLRVDVLDPAVSQHDGRVLVRP